MDFSWGYGTRGQRLNNSETKVLKQRIHYVNLCKKTIDYDQLEKPAY